MRAVVQDRYGPLAEVLEVRDIPIPDVGDDEVLVRVHAASLHPDVWHVVTGRPRILRLMGAGLVRPRQPVPGTDMAGVVEAAGRKVTAFRAGQAVFGETRPGQQWTHGGAFAEYVTARAEWLAPKPDAVSFAEAASVPTSGYIALLNLRGAVAPAPGFRTLVNGAGGGVGSLAVQILKARGAYVTAVDSSGKLDMLRRLGADRVMDYTQEDFTRGPDRYDLIFDVPGNHPLPACRRVLAPGGTYVLIGHEHYDGSRRPLLGLFPRFIGFIVRSLFTSDLRVGRVPTPTRAGAMAELRDLLAAGRITPVVDSVYPLDEVREAFRHLIEDEVRGKVILSPRPAG